MINLCAIVEGHSELKFSKNILSPYLSKFNVFLVETIMVHTSKDVRGGLVNYLKAKNDILGKIRGRERSDWKFTTMFDLYRLPNKFPKYDETKRIEDKYRKVEFIEEAMKEDICASLNDFDEKNFIPYIQLHEFETLLLASPQSLEYEYIGREREIAEIIQDMCGEENPELINDGEKTAPSKRILEKITEYDKVSGGVKILQKIGIDTLKSKCRHFREWLTRLEGLSK